LIDLRVALGRTEVHEIEDEDEHEGKEIK